MEIKLPLPTNSKVLATSNSIDLFDWQLEFHTFYTKLNNKKNKLDMQIKNFLKECEEFLRINSTEGVLKPNIQIPTRLQTQYQNIKKFPSTSSWKDGTWEKILELIESFFSWVSKSSVALSRDKKIKNVVENTQFLKFHERFFRKPTTQSDGLIKEEFLSTNTNRN